MITGRTASRIEAAGMLLKIRRELLDLVPDAILERKDRDSLADAAEIVDGLANKIMGVE